MLNISTDRAPKQYRALKNHRLRGTLLVSTAARPFN
jgi:hypothetical protein